MDRKRRVVQGLIAVATLVLTVASRGPRIRRKGHNRDDVGRRRFGRHMGDGVLEYRGET